jgi:hypothetical protein
LKVEAIGNYFKVWVDNKLVVDFIDKGISSQLAGGNIAMYRCIARMRREIRQFQVEKNVGDNHR